MFGVFIAVAFGLAAALSWGVSDYLGGYSSKKIGYYNTTAYVGLFSAIVTAPFLLYAGISSAVNNFILFLAILASVSAFFGFLLSNKAFKYGNISINTPIINSYTVVVVLVGVFVLNDTISNYGAMSISAILVGIILLSTRASRSNLKKRYLAVGVGSAVLAMLALSVISIFAGAYINQIGFAQLAFLESSVIAICGFSAKRVVGGRIPKNFGHIRYAAFSGITNGLAFIAYMYALNLDSSTLPILSAVSGFSTAVTVILAIILLRERPALNQKIGIALAAAGIIALAYIAA